jgi:hypothetical protein
MERRQNFQTVAWLYDIYKRDLLELDPPYQRRSVWNHSYKEYFIDTIIQNYPIPAIFLYEEIDENGIAKYNVVDGKQRLTALFEFIQNVFPVSEDATKTELRGKFFDEFPPGFKNKLWGYSILIEYLPTAEESVINNIFDRINRNVAKLTPQELRHARFSGNFISSVEEYTDYLNNLFEFDFPRIAPQSRKQMKDVEIVAQLFLLIEEKSPKGYSKDNLDGIFSEKDEEWDKKSEVETSFKKTLSLIQEIINSDDSNKIKDKFKTQVDFYSLFSAILTLSNSARINTTEIKDKLIKFIDEYNDETKRGLNEDLNKYYIFSQTGVNRTNARIERMNTLLKYLGE